jgi:hypothetical protein
VACPVIPQAWRPPPFHSCILRSARSATRELWLVSGCAATLIADWVAERLILYFHMTIASKRLGRRKRCGRSHGTTDTKRADLTASLMFAVRCFLAPD